MRKDPPLDRFEHTVQLGFSMGNTAIRTKLYFCSVPGTLQYPNLWSLVNWRCPLQPVLKRERRHHATVLLIKGTTDGSDLVLVCTNSSNFSYRRQDPIKTHTVCTNLRLSVHEVSTKNAQPRGSSRPRDKKPSPRPNARAPQCILLPACCAPGLELGVYLVPRA